MSLGFVEQGFPIFEGEIYHIFNISLTYELTFLYLLQIACPIVQDHTKKFANHCTGSSFVAGHQFSPVTPRCGRGPKSRRSFGGGWWWWRTRSKAAHLCFIIRKYLKVVTPVAILCCHGVRVRCSTILSLCLYRMVEI